MEIILLRHGKPEIEMKGRFNPEEWREFLKKYDEVHVDPKSLPSSEALEIASSSDVVVCSELLRSSESAKILGVKKIDFENALFNESPMPHGLFKRLRLTLLEWTVFYRIAQWFGYTIGTNETGREGNVRALECANLLVELARSNKKVLHVGHYGLNSYIAVHLLKMGWAGNRGYYQKHWEFWRFKYSGDLKKAMKG
ncbi:MAG: hypothetical protein COA99_17010 [Moraxellaceae bacterium]|nr:MAG: hypothetical protein COA99_17010 [Moraxellaceae bacterium]